MKLYRYYCDKVDEINTELNYNNYDFPSEGIFSRLERIARANPDKYTFPIRYISRKLCDGVPFPMDDRVLYNMKVGIPMLECFTELTNDKYQSEIKSIGNYLLNIHGMGLKCNIIDIDETTNLILYRDEYQVILGLQ